MLKITPSTLSSVVKSSSVDADEFEGEEENFKQLTPDEAKVLRKKFPPVSPWRVIAWQGLVGVLVALIAWIVTGSGAVGWSVAYGALAVVIPAAILARGMSGPLSKRNPGSAMVYFFMWEAVKVILTVAMLYVAPRMVANLSWLAMLAGFVVTMKVVWVAVLFLPKRSHVA